MSRRDAIVSALGELAHMPPTMAKILDIIDQPETTPRELARVISLDPVLTFEILKLINSAFHGIPREVTNVAQAVILLGFKVVKNLCLTLGLAQATRDGAEDRAGFQFDAFWRHSLAVGLLAKLIAAELKWERDRVNEAFLAGLLHDIGKIMLFRIVPEEYEKIVTVNLKRNIPLLKLEAQFLGITHAEVGAQIGERWRFHQGFIESILNHHEVPEEGDFRPLHQVVNLANFEATRVGYSGAGSAADQQQQLDHEAALELGLGVDRLRELSEQELPKAVTDAQSFLSSLAQRKKTKTQDG